MNVSNYPARSSILADNLFGFGSVSVRFCSVLFETEHHPPIDGKRTHSIVGMLRFVLRTPRSLCATPFDSTGYRLIVERDLCAPHFGIQAGQ